MNKIKMFFSSLLKKDATKTVITSLWCALIGLILGFIILLFINAKEAAYGMTSVLGNYLIFSNPQDRLNYFGQTLAKTAPLIAMSLSILVSYKAGLFNLGASGQYSIAVIVISFLGIGLNWPWWIVMILAMISASAFAMISGALKAYFNVNEVISGIMLNWIALYLTNGILSNSTNVWDSAHSETYTISNSSNAYIPSIGLDKVFAGNSIVGLGMVLILIVVAVIFILFKKTTIGYELKATGLNGDAADYAGINKIKNIFIATGISGALAGLAAVLSLQNGFTAWRLGSTPPDIGFQGISSAFLGGLHPIGVIFSSYFIVHITEGGSMITDLGFSPEVASIMTSVIIYLSGFVVFVKEVMHKHEIKNELNKLTREKEEEV
ncbi:MAG: ABC transporter permease [Bacilli bacterium]|nr:ABC transporter permease [Bacilli bacterium]